MIDAFIIFKDSEAQCKAQGVGETEVRQALAEKVRAPPTTLGLSSKTLGPFHRRHPRVHFSRYPPVFGFGLIYTVSGNKKFPHFKSEK